MSGNEGVATVRDVDLREIIIQGNEAS